MTRMFDRRFGGFAHGSGATSDFRGGRSRDVPVAPPPVQADRQTGCRRCNGTGREECFGCNGARRLRCQRCGGGGRTTIQGRTLDCSGCGGAGRNDCADCGGLGTSRCSGCGGTGQMRA